MSPPPWSFPPNGHGGHGDMPWGGRRRVFRYPVYARRHDYYPGWLPPGAMQVYGHHGHPPHHAPTHYYEEFRSNSANLPVPPPVDYVWSRPARRTQSSAHTLARPFQPNYSEFHPSRSRRDAPPQKPTLNHQSSFASRFFNEREPKTENQSHIKTSLSNASHMIHGRVLIEPDVHDKHSLVSQVLVSRPSSRTSRTSHHTDRTSSAASNKLSDKLSDKLRPSSRVSQLSQNHVRTPSGSSDKRNVLPEDESYRVVSELLPHSTQQIHEAILEAGRKISNSSSKSQSSCTCYQCQNSQKSSQNSLPDFGHKTPYTSLIPDINSNLIVPGR